MYTWYMLLGILCGLITGIFSGLVGVGGGLVMIPIMTLFFGFSQHLAQGTSLAVMLPPIGLLAVWAYYKEGLVNIPLAGWIILGFIFGSWFGAKGAIFIPDLWLKKCFGLTMIAMGIKFVFFK